MSAAPKPFDPALHRDRLVPLLRALDALERWSPQGIDRLLRQHPKDGAGFFSRSDLIAAFRAFGPDSGLAIGEAEFRTRLRRKPVRSQSGLAPVTVLTKPFPCPGRCVFCPNDPTMPKSYVASEPGCQRAESHGFDPYLQTFERTRALHRTGHAVDKVELLVLGGTWSHHPEPYQIWFVKRCLDALNDLGAGRDGRSGVGPRSDFRDLRVPAGGSYNATVSARAREGEALAAAGFGELARAQQENEGAAIRCVGLVLETRPDCIDPAEVVRLRRLGATKIQLGVQSLDDAILARNRRGHDVEASRRAVTLLRRAGFKIHLHWMPNLLGATPASDARDFGRLFADPALRPDELKIYPCSLIEGTELVAHHASGAWRPYDDAELTDLLAGAMARVPEWCRLTRVIRDIPSQEILVGNRRTNFREIASRALAARGGRCLDVRSREVGQRPVDAAALALRRSEYATRAGREVFLQACTPDDRIAGFARLLLPTAPAFLPELAGP